jgi:Family of unknown function (DUF6600)
MRTRGTVGLLLCALVVAASPAAARAAAGDNAAGPDAGPPPGVARVSVVESGSVVITRHDTGAAVTATVNAPLLPGDGFATAGDEARAEIQLDGFTALRLGDAVKARIAANDAQARRIELDAGLLELAVLRGGTLATEIVTPALVVRTKYAGDYRVVVSGSTTYLTARSGQADAIAPSGTSTVVAGQTLEAHLVDGRSTVGFRPAIARDGFDAFNDARDQTLLSALDNNTHVPASIAGYDDLNDYGSWTNVASYGEVWVPDQTADFAPYRDGEWSYAGSYGWTWVGGEPWGWVPYHYGSWIYARSIGWCWYPPPIGIVPVWAPGLVAFFGYGFGPYGYSGYGWVPLAPYEPYIPWYPWQWWYAGGRFPHRPLPPPPPPPKHHRPGPPKRMHPMDEYRNVQFGGATTIGAAAWREGNFTRAVAADPARLESVTAVRERVPMKPTPANLQFASPVRAPETATRMMPAWQTEFEHAAQMLSAPATLRLPQLPPGMAAPVMHAPGQHAPQTHTAPPGSHSAPPGTHAIPPGTQPPPGTRASPPLVHSPPTTNAPPHASPPIVHAPPSGEIVPHPPP